MPKKDIEVLSSWLSRWNQGCLRKFLNDSSSYRAEEHFKCQIWYNISDLLRQFDFLTATLKEFILVEILRFSVQIHPFLYARLEMGPYYVIGYGRRMAGVHTGFRTITLVLYIGSLPNLASWFPCGRGRTLFILGSLGQRSRSLLL